MYGVQEAIDADGLNPLARYEYASVLISLERFNDAIAELERLKVRAPQLALVAVLMCIDSVQVLSALQRQALLHVELVHARACRTSRRARRLCSFRWAASTRSLGSVTQLWSTSTVHWTSSPRPLTRISSSQQLRSCMLTTTRWTTRFSCCEAATIMMCTGRTCNLCAAMH
jgi:hypothetical protein